MLERAANVLGMDRLARLRRRLGSERITPVTAAILTALYGMQAFADGADNGARTLAANGSSDPVLQEVTVTATRRAESAQNIPISITAVTGADLDQAGIEDLSALAQSMAGVNFTDKGPFSGVNGSGLIIRGLNSEGTAGQLALATPVVPPVATYVNDTPLYFNLQLQDLNRVEILRGPQGTLYGSGSLGGTIRFVQNAPDPSGFDAHAEVDFGDTQHTHAPNERVEAMLNVPLSDTLAVRVNAGVRYDAGFINEPNLYVLQPNGAPAPAQPGNVFSPPETYERYGTNSYQYHTARVSLLWQPNELLRLQLNYYYQLGTADGFPYVATNSAAYNQMLGSADQQGMAANCAFAASQGVPCVPAPAAQLYNLPLPSGINRLSSAENSLDAAHDTVDITALNLEYDLGFASLTGDASWSQHLNHSSDDLTAEYTNFVFYQSIYGQNPRSYVVGHDELDDRPLTFELRLASKLGGRFDWIAGLFYKNESQDIQEHEFEPGYLDFFNGCTALHGAETGNQFDYNIPSYCGVGETGYTAGAGYSLYGIPVVKDQTYIGDFETRFKDLAAFGELTVHLTPQWSLTGGTRVFKQTVDQSQQTGLLFDSGGAFLVPIAQGGFGPPPVANNPLSASWRKALWKLNTAYQLDHSNLIYATWSQGFRRGGVNALPPAEPAQGNYVTPSALTKLEPDTADNYEVGIKGTLLGRFRYSADVFEIQWHNIQEGVPLTPLVLPAALNIGDAFSRGFEMELDALFSRHWSATLDYTYDQTKLTSLNALFTYPNVAVPPPSIGSPLPGTPKNSLAVGPAFETALAGGEIRLAVNAHYQSSMLPALSGTVPTVPAYTMLDVRLSFARDHWVGAFYIDNVTDNLGITSYSDPAIFGNRYQAIISQPRTFGLTLSYSFRAQ